MIFNEGPKEASRTKVHSVAKTRSTHRHVGDTRSLIQPDLKPDAVEHDGQIEQYDGEERQQRYHITAAHLAKIQPRFPR